MIFQRIGAQWLPSIGLNIDIVTFQISQSFSIGYFSSCSYPNDFFELINLNYSGWTLIEIEFLRWPIIPSANIFFS